MTRWWLSVVWLGACSAEPQPTAIERYTSARMALRSGDAKRAIGLIHDAKAEPGNLTRAGELNAMQALARSRESYPQDNVRDAQAKHFQSMALEFLAEGDVESAEAMALKVPADARNETTAAIADFRRQLQEAAAARPRGSIGCGVMHEKPAGQTARTALAFEVVERKFMSGDWARAASECARVAHNNHDDQDIVDRAKMLKSAIPSFGKAYDDGLKKYRAKQLLYALKPLKEAMRTYKQIGLTGNDFGRDIKTKLLDCLVAAGSDALHRDVLLEAVINFREALKFDEFNPTAKDGINQIESRAPELFEYAYRMKDSNNELAIRNFRLVIEITRPGDQLHEKAKNQLEAITNAH